MNETKPARIVCLDIDGVLASDRFYSKRHEKGQYFEKSKIDLLNQLTGAYVLVTSSWGPDGGRTTELLKEAGLELPIIGYTRKVHWEFEWACRGNEIREWFLKTYGSDNMAYGDHNDDFYEYVIFDDDTDMLLGQKGHFIHVNSWTGLAKRDIERAKKILKL